MNHKRSKSSHRKRVRRMKNRSKRFEGSKISGKRLNTHLNTW